MQVLATLMCHRHGSTTDMGPPPAQQATCRKERAGRCCRSSGSSSEWPCSCSPRPGGLYPHPWPPPVANDTGPALATHLRAEVLPCRSSLRAPTLPTPKFEPAHKNVPSPALVLLRRVRRVSPLGVLLRASALASLRAFAGTGRCCSSSCWASSATAASAPAPRPAPPPARSRS